MQRNTRQRQIILEELRKLTTHPSASVLYDIVRRRLPRISLATVYRNLELLSREGVILKLDLGCSETRFDGTTTTHYHIRCTHCDRVDDVQELRPERLPEVPEYIAGYEVEGYSLEFQGLCTACRQLQ